jgi:4-carboxymuconolactone decarboxylase
MMKKTLAWSAALILVAAGGFALGANRPAGGAAPRFAQLTMAQMDARQRPLAEYILKFSRVGLGGPYHLMLRSPGAAKPMLELLDYLRFHSSVPARLNEFAILIQARLWRSQMEWYGHYDSALRAGISAATLTELKANKRPVDMKPDEAAVYDFCAELYRRHAVSDATFGRLHQYLNDRQIVDLTLASGTYVSIASLLAMAEQNPPAGVPLPFKPGQP